MGTEYQRISHGFETFLNLCTLVDIEQLITLKNISASLIKNLLNLSCENCMGNYKAQVTSYSRIFGNSCIFVVETSKFQNIQNVDHCDICFFSDRVIICNSRMNLT